MCMMRMIKYTISVTLMQRDMLHGRVRSISLKGAGEAESQKAEHLSPFSVGLFLVTVNLDLREWSAIS